MVCLQHRKTIQGYLFAQIDVIDSTETTAVVRVMAENWHGVGFVDHHSLVKTDKGWKIVDKIYHTL